MREKLKIRDEASKAYLNRFERLLMQLTRHELDGHAEFLDDCVVPSQPLALFRSRQTAIPLGLYELPRRSGEAHLYRLNHPLAEALLAQAKSRDLPPRKSTSTTARHDGKVIHPGTVHRPVRLADALVSSPSNRSTRPKTTSSSPPSPTKAETLDEETATRLLTLPGSASPLPAGRVAGLTEQALGAQTARQRAAIQNESRSATPASSRPKPTNSTAGPMTSSSAWSARSRNWTARSRKPAAPPPPPLTLGGKARRQKQIKALEAQRNQKRRSSLMPRMRWTGSGRPLIADIEGKLLQQHSLDTLFRVRWSLRALAAIKEN